jgi:hypothetical protein
MNTLSRRGYDGVPSPVTGSQPATAEKPSVPHPGFEPLLISFKALGFAYKTGFMKPTGPLPFFIRSWLMRVMIEPNVGAEAEVPYTRRPPSSIVHT